MMTNKIVLTEIGIGESYLKLYGLPYTNADKRKIIKRALLHPYARGMSDRQIGRHVGVHHNTVGRVRRELEAAGEFHDQDLRSSQQHRTAERSKQASGASEQTRQEEKNGHEN